MFMDMAILCIYLLQEKSACFSTWLCWCLSVSQQRSPYQSHAVRNSRFTVTVFTGLSQMDEVGDN